MMFFVYRVTEYLVPSVRNNRENGLVDCSVTRVLGDGSARKRGELATERRSG